MNELCGVTDMIPSDPSGALYTTEEDFEPGDLVYLEPKDSPPPQEDLASLLSKLALVESRPAKSEVTMVNVYNKVATLVRGPIPLEEALVYIKENEAKGPFEVRSDVPPPLNGIGIKALGHFAPYSSRPAIRLMVYRSFPSSQTPHVVPFLIDTGASYTCLNRLQKRTIDKDFVPTEKQSVGIVGGGPPLT
jgi:hypothetical protein